MMFCEYGIVEDYKDCTYEELLDLRSRVMEDIIDFEEDRTSEINWWRKPGADIEYSLNLEFLSELISAINRKFRQEHDEMLRAVRSGEFKANSGEGRVSQVKRYIRTRNEAPEQMVLDDTDVIELTISNDGTVEAYRSGDFVGTVADIDPETYRFDTGNFNEPFLLLNAEHNNRRFIGAGGLKKTSWEIYSDGAYRIIKVFNLGWGEIESASSEEADAGRADITTGILDDERFRNLKLAINNKPWSESYIEADPRDESTWIINMFDEMGNVVNSSGEPGSIRGFRNLEAIVACLPSDKDRWSR